MIKHEYIICAAIWFDDGIDRELPEIQGRTGFVIAGRRHHNCFNTAHILTDGGLRKDLPQQEVQGFLTNKNRFIDRHEAVKVAFEVKQTEFMSEHPQGLFSEDLY
jgi:hypothetical protein